MAYSVMLASPPSGAPAQVIEQMERSGDWAFEIKFDGIRAVVALTNGVPQITNRRGRDITFRYPEVVAAMTGLPDMVLDGEIVCLRNGRPDFSLIHRRDAQGSARAAAQLASTSPAQFVVFDVLIRAGVDLRALPYSARRKHVDELCPQLSDHQVMCSPSSGDGLSMWAAVQDLGLEGLIAKRLNSRYVGRRTGAWVKIKLTHRVTALVSGWDAGEGSRASTFGALRLALIDGGDLVDVGSVGSGFSQADLDLVWGRLRANDHPIMVDVAYLEVSPSGVLRQPVFRGLRLDVEPSACSMDQLRREGE